MVQIYYKGIKKLLFTGGFLNKSRIEVSLSNWEIVFFLTFSHGICSMYIPEGMCTVRNTENPLVGVGLAILSLMIDI